MSVCLNSGYLKGFISERELCEIFPIVKAAHELLVGRSGAGSDFLGWLDLPVDYDRGEFSRIKAVAEKIRQDSDILVVIGIGGSYLGSRAVIEAINSQLYNLTCSDAPRVYFVGNSISPTYFNEILRLCEGKDVCVNVISKSGTTTEPAIAFRVFKNWLEEKYGVEGARSRIYCTTDKNKGKLKELALRNSYEQFVIPDDIGGRFSVLTAVGLLPMAVAGLDISAVMAGAAEAVESFCDCDLEKNDCYKYAAIRNILYNKGKRAEMLVSYEPSMTAFLEWYKQLFGESEGKDDKGILPTSAIFSTDLHSLGQYIQDGSKIIFETVLDFKKPREDFYIYEDKGNFDGLNFLANQNMSEINRRAFDGTTLAHTEGKVPNIILELETINEFEIGNLIYFFEKACAISGYMLGVNPFNQPGVEKYKKNMFALLGKPGFEDMRKEILNLISKSS